MEHLIPTGMNDRKSTRAMPREKMRKGKLLWIHSTKCLFMKTCTILNLIT